MSEDRPELPEREGTRRDFIAEAEEIFEALGDDLRELETVFAAGKPHHELINTLFREVHSLKGFAGLLGFPQIASLSHALEDLLSRLRLGGAVDGTVLDLLHDTLDALLGAVRDLRAGAAAPRDLEPLRKRLHRTSSSLGVPEGGGLGGLLLPERVRASLTEHEEKRLCASLTAGSRVSLVRIRTDPRSVEKQLREVARRIAEVGELISTVPAAGEEGETMIVFDLLVAGPRALIATDLPEESVVWIREIDAPPSSARIQASGQAPVDESGRSPHASGVFEDLAGPSSSLRVPVRRLDEVLAQVGELSAALASLERAVVALRERHADDRAARDLGPRLLDALNRLRALQRSAIDARLMPLEQVFGKAGRMVARAARTTGKEVDLHTLGADTEIDKSVMDVLTPPLMHLVANALDHGIEAPDERERASKPRRGRVVLSAFRKGPSVVIDVIDDGRGIAREAVRAAAEARGLVRPGREMTPEEAHEMIFRPGFSTAATVSEVSGRGVGMDVVRSSIRGLKGTIVVRSVEGQGTTFTVTVPISLALVPAIIVRSRGQRFAIPIASIRENVRLDGARVRVEGGGEIFDRPDGPLPLLRLHRLMRNSGDDTAGGKTGEGSYAVVASSGERAIGIVVDAFVGRREVVVKPIGRFLRDIPGVAGATDLGDATAVVVLDPEGLIAGDRDVSTAS